MQSATPKKEPSIGDYKLYVRQLKARIQGMKDQNNKLIVANSGMKNERDKEIKQKCMDFAMQANQKITKIQVTSP